MMSLFRVAPVRLAAVALAVFGAVPVSGQQAPANPAAATPVDHSAWLYKGSDIPQDPEWKFGTLANGVRYAARKNGVPPGQVAIRVRIDAGSLMERDSEQGFAHLIEHLTFRGSKYVPENETRQVWQRMGATFGVDSNAQTTFTQTTYKIDLPGITPETLDNALRIMSGMVESPTITQAALDSERPAVLAELHEQPAAQVRFGDKMRQFLFAGQPLADRAPIGKEDIIKSATPAAIQAFHDRWYRPQRAVVVISGDIDPTVAGELIAKNFSSWQGTGPAPAEPDFGKPVADAPTTIAVAEPSLPPIVVMDVLRPWTFNADTILFNQNRMVDSLALQIINRRLETRARAGGSFLQAQAGLDDVSRSANVTSVNIVPLAKNWSGALKDVRGVIADAMAAPPSQAEIDREITTLDGAMQADADTARGEQGTAKADEMVQALDIRETTTNAASALAIYRDAVKKRFFTPARVLASTRKVFQGTATRALVNTQAPDAQAASTLAADLKVDVSKLAGKRGQLGKVSLAQLPPLGAPGKVVSRITVAGLDFQQITFANGVRMQLFATPSEADKVYVLVRFGHGYRQLPSNALTPAWAGDSALVASGIGPLTQDGLDRVSAGRRLNLDFDINDDAFALMGVTSAKDLPDQLKLAATKLAFPRWDPNPVERAKAGALTAYDGFDASPDAVLGRDLEGLLHDGDPRWTTPTPDQIKALTPAAFRKFWEPIVASGPIEVDVFGDVKADEAIAAVANTFGALKPRQTAPLIDAPIRFPAHNAAPVMRTHTGAENQAAAVIAWPTGGGAAGSAEARQLDVLAAVFSDRLFDRLRTEAGISYSPNVGSQWPLGLPTGGRLIAIGQVPPDKTGFFFQVARQIAADLVATPISAEELARTKEPMRQALLRGSTGDVFWLRLAMGGSYDPARIVAAKMLPQDFAAINSAQLQAVAQKYLRPDRDWTMVVLPAKTGK